MALAEVCLINSFSAGTWVHVPANRAWLSLAMLRRVLACKRDGVDSDVTDSLAAYIRNHFKVSVEFVEPKSEGSVV